MTVGPERSTGITSVRRALAALSPWFARRDRLRIVMDHLDKTKEYLHRHYLRGGRKDAEGKIIHEPFEVCLHKILRSDNDFLHDHPGSYFGLILAGVYREHTPEGVFTRRPGYIRVRSKHTLHRLEIIDGPVWTLFVFLNRPAGTDSDWYFLVNGKRVHQAEHLDDEPISTSGSSLK
jgi:hypothetical protein